MIVNIIKKDETKEFERVGECNISRGIHSTYITILYTNQNDASVETTEIVSNTELLGVYIQ